MASISSATPSMRIRPGLSRLRAGGVGVAAARLLGEQLAGESAEQLAHRVVEQFDLAAGNLFPGADALTAQLAALAGVLQSWETGPLGMVLVLLWPVGGPVWGGVVPVSASVRGARGCWRLTRRVAASRHAAVSAVVDTGQMTVRVLIVDDSRPFRELAHRVLTRDGLDVVGLAATGEEALSLVDRLDPHIALIDIHLGNESGFDLARDLARRATCGTVVVMMSTHGESEVRELLADSPVAGFLPKERISGEAVRSIAGRRG